MIITILRKPLEGSVADNVLKHGCGALNIDDTRVEGEPWKWGTQTDIKGGGFGSNRPSDGNILRKNVEGGFNGRWPANFILTHLDGCELKGTKKIRGIKGGTGNHKGSVYGERSNVGSPVKDYANKDGKEEVADWACVEGCPVRELDQQSGNRKTTWVSTSHKNNRQGDFLGALGHPKDQGYNDEGGASRFFKQFKKDNE